MGFGKRSTAAQVTEGIDLSGKTAVVTGVNSGLGLETMRALAACGAHVVGLARTQEKADEACASVDGKTTGVACELSDLDSVQAAAATINAMAVRIDILMTNAGIMAPQDLSLANGVELQFATNHLGHYLLVALLLDAVRRAEAGRIVILSSAAHTWAPGVGIDFDNLDGAYGYNPMRFYGQSKLANLLHARHLAQQLGGTGITVNALHPGVIQTNLGRDGGAIMKVMGLFMRPFMKSIAQGAATQCYLAAHPDLEGVTGAYFSDCAEARTSAWGNDMELADELCQETEKMLKGYL